MKIGIWALIFILGINTVNAYVFNRGNAGVFIKWPQNNRNISFYLNTSNNDALSSSEVQSIVSSSISQWNSSSDINISLGTTSGVNQSGINEISFTSRDSWFSDPSIVGVTQVIYDSDSGQITEADIHINDVSHNLTDLDTSAYYLGNVISHELGHAIGLDHSQVHKSTMFYQNQAGQNTLSSDDKAGAFSMYSSISSKGSISGKIIGGPNLTSVFGAHVMAISQITGQVAASTISESDGSFIISGLDLESTYYVYVEPIKNVETVPFYYQVRRTDFCEDGASYQGSYFQGCYSRDEGFPQGVSLTASNTSQYIGSITIRCGLDVPTNYILNKPSQENELDIFEESGDTAYIGEAIVGYFSETR